MEDFLVVVLIAVFGFVSNFVLKDMKRSRRGDFSTMKRPEQFSQENAVESDTYQSEKLPENTEVNREEGRFSFRQKGPLNTSGTASLIQQEPSNNTQKDKGMRKSPFKHLTKEQLREGIILAEVLSERPRSQNPHPAVSKYDRTKG